jgi:hypothetical protein
VPSGAAQNAKSEEIMATLEAIDLTAAFDSLEERRNMKTQVLREAVNRLCQHGFCT